LTSDLPANWQVASFRALCALRVQNPASHPLQNPERLSSVFAVLSVKLTWEKIVSTTSRYNEKGKIVSKTTPEKN
jgi:hypothetical protein